MGNCCSRENNDEEKNSHYNLLDPKIEKNNVQDNKLKYKSGYNSNRSNEIDSIVTMSESSKRIEEVSPDMYITLTKSDYMPESRPENEVESLGKDTPVNNENNEETIAVMPNHNNKPIVIEPVNDHHSVVEENTANDKKPESEDANIKTSRLDFTTDVLIKAEQGAKMFNRESYALYNIEEAQLNYNDTNYLEYVVIDDDSYYCGEVNESNQRHGYGVLMKRGGIKYEGYWTNDVFECFGRHIDSKGLVRQGNFKNWLLNGLGEEITKSYYFMGEFTEGFKNGKGNYTSEEEIYEGDYLNNARSGTGVLTIKRTNDIYAGDFKNDFTSGIGKITFGNGDIYTGGFKDGKFHGKGKYTWENGDVYEGDYELGVKEGFGTWHWIVKNKAYIGPIHANLPHGTGLLKKGEKQNHVVFEMGRIIKHIGNESSIEKET